MENDLWRAFTLAAAVFFGGICTSIASKPQQHEEWNGYAKGSQEFTCRNTLPGADGNPYRIWATVKKSELNVGWHANAEPGITTMVEPRQGIRIARQFCN